MGIRGYDFDDFGEGLSDGARANLDAAVESYAHVLGEADPEIPSAHHSSKGDTEVEPCPTTSPDSLYRRRSGRSGLPPDRPGGRGLPSSPVPPAPRRASTSIKRVRPDALIVDLMMEEVDAGTRSRPASCGWKATTRPIFMLSSVGDNLSQTTDVGALGLAGVFQKPLRKDHLLAVLEMSLGTTA